MRTFRLFIFLALVGLFATACVSPTGPRYPTPDETGEGEPNPKPGIAVVRG